MSVALLAEWLDALCEERPELSVCATGVQAVFCIDPGEGAPLLAIEWEPQAHGLHLYGHPGHARVAAAQAEAEGEDDEREEGEAVFAAAHAGAGAASETRVLELGADAHGQCCLHVQAHTGLMTLSVKRSLASLDRSSFVAWIDDALMDMAMWTLASGIGSADGPGTASRTGPWPWDVTLA